MAQVLDNPSSVQFFRPQLEITAEDRLRRLIDEHEGKLAASFDDLLGGGEEPGETADDIVNAVREWRDFASENSLN